MKNITTKVFILAFLASACLTNFTEVIAEENQLKDVIKLVMPATVLVMTYDAKGEPLAQGSGFFVSETGELITNYHVFKDAESIEVKCPDNSVYKITLVIAEDLTSDLVKLQADTGGKKVPWLKLNKAKIDVGEKIVVIGSPKGLEATVSDGIVSAVRDVPGFGNIIQITAPVSPGSSGSAVVNMKGEVIGVASAQMREGQNLNFVVPAERIVALKEKKQTIMESKTEGSKKESDNIYSAALAYYLTKDYEKALPLFKQYLQNNKNSDEAWLYIGGCYAALSRWEEALEAFKQLTKLKPNDAGLYDCLGAVYAALGRWEEAIEAYKQTIKLKPGDAEAHYDLGYAYAKSHRYQEAIEAYKQAIKLKPDYAEAYKNLGNAYYGLNRHQEALEAYKQAIKLKPDDAKAYLFLGGSYFDLGRPKEAIQAYKQAIKLKPDYADAHLMLGLKYLIIGDKGSALKEYEMLKSLDPESANILFNMIYK
jgi:tetratricopeptide (TPR) repeat protein